VLLLGPLPGGRQGARRGGNRNSIYEIRTRGTRENGKKPSRRFRTGPRGETGKNY
jgi:hypothetical protein